MIFNVALIEDNKCDKNHFKRCFEELCKETSIPIQLNCYANSDEFFNQSNQCNNFDCIFLDIDLPSINGIEIAKKLRSTNTKVDFIFLTSYREYVFDGYSVSAIDYLLKPITVNTLNKCMKRMLKKHQSGFYTFRSKKDIIHIPHSKILCFSSAQHYTEIITTDKVYRQRKPISDILSMLPEEYVQVHRTIIVNIHQVYCISGNTVIMNNQQQYPVSKTYSKTLNSAFIQYIF